MPCYGSESSESLHQLVDGDVLLLGLLAVFLDRERALPRFRYASGGSLEGSSILANLPVRSASRLSPLSVEF